ncbi:RNA polymerase RpoN-/SigL-like sigma 54 subunit [Dongia mobilis]|uniref:RNA polymerase sigma-54 factor n=1 Tax=Dongia mobilis TaxID=578943 RepID=A0A4R6WMA8_9PROT|nr:RNA polymerase factor sigma-54 [Dongia mobilis]TDQ82129.1 RNA polymerase RpoN-/SigL-like sigma 54 subunit [Dongia mobilis]
MAITQRMDLRQAQSLVMTPQLQQAIKLLELSNQELAAYIEQELEQNPLLDREEGGRTADTPAAEGDRLASLEAMTSEPATPQESERLLDASEYGRDGVQSERQSPLDTDYDNLYNTAEGDRGAEGRGEAGFAESWSGSGGGRSDFGDDEFGLEQTLSRPESLREHLEQQLYLDIHGPTERMIGLQLIDLIDDAGYLTGDLAELAERLGCSAAAVENVLARMQQFDPCGVFARNLAECLALQLKERNRFDPAMAALLAHLDLLAKHDRNQLMKVCGVDAEDLAEMVGEIRALNPKPGASFEPVEIQAVVPDILVWRRPDGSWSVELNSEQLPRLLVNQHYHAQVLPKAHNKVERDYLNERLATANWLVKTLHQRATTILKVATEIVRQQEAFFLHGVQHLKPLIRRDIAEAIGMHESTVSRVTTNKFMATPRGIFELRYFFTAAIQGADGQSSHSAESVRQKIKELIDAEPADDVLSDDRLVAILQGQGVDIARRTVAKYRESLRISSSVQRRREKALRSA